MISNAGRDFLKWARTPLTIAVASRVALFVIAWGMLLRRPRRAFPDVPYRPYLDGWFNWDAGWYVDIMKHGYRLLEHEPGQRNTVFFPLYPLVTRGVSSLTGGDLMWASVLVSNLAFIAAAVIFYRWVLERWDRRTAEASLLLMATSPFAFYFNACYTESLFLLTWVAAFYAAHRGAWWLAGICVALSGATRLVGVVGVAGLGLVALEQAEWQWRKLSPRVLWLGLGGLGLAGFAGYLQYTLGDPLLFTGQNGVAGWGLNHHFQEDVLNLLDVQAWLRGKVRIGDVSHFFMLVPATALCFAGRKHLGWALMLFCLLALAVYWRVWFSSSRYVLTLFPLYVVMARLLRGRRLAFAGLLALDAVLLGHFLWLYVQRDWVS